ncbi:MAG: (4S)-4-hydroxy-5-phosphonooxypentane-2,3-dione isomerase [Anaerolineae bacterium]
MEVAVITLHVKADKIEEFKAVALENARASIQEAGILRFDVIQRQDDPTYFMLYEVYRTPEDIEAHRQTPHYAKWRERSPELIADRTSFRYAVLTPLDEANWTAKHG